MAGRRASRAVERDGVATSARERLRARPPRAPRARRTPPPGRSGLDTRTRPPNPQEPVGDHRARSGQTPRPQRSCHAARPSIPIEPPRQAPAALADEAAVGSRDPPGRGEQGGQRVVGDLVDAVGQDVADGDAAASPARGSTLSVCRSRSGRSGAPRRHRIDRPAPVSRGELRPARNRPRRPWRPRSPPPSGTGGRRSRRLSGRKIASSRSSRSKVKSVTRTFGIASWFSPRSPPSRRRASIRRAGSKQGRPRARSGHPRPHTRGSG